jgi:hypothetical protein
LNTPVKNTDPGDKIFAAATTHFTELSLDVFQFQYNCNPVYQQYCTLMGVRPETVQHLGRIPFLPVSFFKTHTVKTTTFEPEAIFESSGTSQTINSRHHIRSLDVYRESILRGFKKQYGNPEDWCILALLPSYLERNNASLVWMANTLIETSGHPHGGFYLNDFAKLHSRLLHNELVRQPTLLLGVSFALLDFAAAYRMDLNYTTVMETGGMKGRREELTRDTLHRQLNARLGENPIHAEYGMTELLSQAYSKGYGRFSCPPWMRVIVRDDDDPFVLHIPDAFSTVPATGLINIIDLANVYSCSFIATDDIGKVYPDGSFEVLGRADHSDLRGCSLLTA